MRFLGPLTLDFFRAGMMKMKHRQMKKRKNEETEDEEGT